MYLLSTKIPFNFSPFKLKNVRKIFQSRNIKLPSSTILHNVSNYSHGFAKRLINEIREIVARLIADVVVEYLLNRECVEKREKRRAQMRTSNVRGKIF